MKLKADFNFAPQWLSGLTIALLEIPMKYFVQKQSKLYNRNNVKNTLHAWINLKDKTCHRSVLDALAKRGNLASWCKEKKTNYVFVSLLIFQLMEEAEKANLLGHGKGRPMVARKKNGHAWIFN